jgi:hypothetical protein
MELNGFCPLATHYRLVFADLRGEDGSDAPHVVMARMTIGEAMRFDELRETEPETSAQLRQKIRDLAQFVAERIISWNFVHADGTPRTADVDGVLSLPDRMMGAIIDAWLTAAREVSDELGKDSTSGTPFPEADIPMEALSPSLENWPEPAVS